MEKYFIKTRKNCLSSLNIARNDKKKASKLDQKQWYSIQEKNKLRNILKKTKRFVACSFSLSFIRDGLRLMSVFLLLYRKSLFDIRFIINFLDTFSCLNFIWYFLCIFQKVPVELNFQFVNSFLKI